MRSTPGGTHFAQRTHRQLPTFNTCAKNPPVTYSRGEKIEVKDRTLKIEGGRAHQLLSAEIGGHGYNGGL